MDGRLHPFDYVARGVELDELLKPWDHDHLVDVLLRVMFPALKKLCQKIFTDHLPGGRYADIDPSTAETLQRVPKHNKFSESIFGFLDVLLHSKPNVITIATEAYIMFSQNKTMRWLEAKDQQAQDKLIQESMHDAKAVRAQFQKRHKAIETAHRERMQNALAKAEELSKKRLQQKESYTTEIIEYGLWQSTYEVDRNLHDNSLPTKEAKNKALKAQLMFRQHVSGQEKGEHGASIFSFSKRVGSKRVQLTIEELADNVKKLVNNARMRSQDS